MAVLSNYPYDLLERRPERSSVFIKEPEIWFGFAFSAKPLTKLIHLGLCHGDEYHMKKWIFTSGDWKP